MAGPEKLLRAAKPVARGARELVDDILGATQRSSRLADSARPPAPFFAGRKARRLPSHGSNITRYEFDHGGKKVVVNFMPDGANTEISWSARGMNPREFGTVTAEVADVVRRYASETGTTRFTLDPATGAHQRIYEALAARAPDFQLTGDGLRYTGATRGGLALTAAAGTGAALAGTERAEAGPVDKTLRAGAGLVDDVVEQGARRIRAYHGSPHDFDRFDSAHIGSGEGAQAYGRGLYFAENEGVARGYRDQLANRRYMPGDAPSPLKTAWSLVSGSADRAAMPTDELLPYVKRAYPETPDSELREAIETAKAEYRSGRVYEVDINASPDDFLDWDKPVKDQPEKVRRFLVEKIGIRDEEISGDALLGIMRRAMERGGVYPEQIDQVIAEEMRDAGIQGIRYLDRGSRLNPGMTVAEGTRNFVVFDDNLIDIVRKYGIAAVLGGGTGAALLGEDAQAGPVDKTLRAGARAVDATLDMSHAARMRRAEEMGFDTPAFHATRGDFEEFKPGSRGASYFSSTADRAHRGALAGQNEWWMGTGGPAEPLPGAWNTIPALIRSGRIEGLALSPRQRAFWESLPDKLPASEWDALAPRVREEFGSIPPWLYDEGEIALPDGRVLRTGDLSKMPDAEYERLRETLLTSPETLFKGSIPNYSYADAVRTGRDIFGNGIGHWNPGIMGEARSAQRALDNGFGGYLIVDEGGVSIAVADPSNIRSVNAAFDPAKSDSANLLASVPAVGAGLAASTLLGENAEAGPVEGPKAAWDLVDEALGPIQADEMPRYRYRHPFEYGAGPEGDPNRIGARLENPRGRFEAAADGWPFVFMPGIGSPNAIARGIGREMDMAAEKPLTYGRDVAEGVLDFFLSPLMREEADARREGQVTYTPPGFVPNSAFLPIAEAEFAPDPNARMLYPFREGGRFTGYNEEQDSAQQGPGGDMLDAAGVTGALGPLGAVSRTARLAGRAPAAFRGAAQVVDDVFRAAQRAAPKVREGAVETFRASRDMWNQLPAGARAPIINRGGVARRDAERVRDAIPELKPESQYAPRHPDDLRLQAEYDQRLARRERQRDVRARLDRMADPDQPAGELDLRAGTVEELLDDLARNDRLWSEVFPGRRPRSPDFDPTRGTFLRDVLDDRPLGDRALSYVNPVSVAGGLGLLALLFPEFDRRTSEAMFDQMDAAAAYKRRPDPRIDITAPDDPPPPTLSLDDFGFAADRRELDATRLEQERRRREVAKTDSEPIRIVDEIMEQARRAPPDMGAPPVAPGTEAPYDLTALSGDDLRIPTITPERGAVYGENAPFRYGVPETLGNNRPNVDWSNRKQIDEWIANPPDYGQGGLGIAEGDPTLGAIADLVVRRIGADVGGAGYGQRVRAWVLENYGIDLENATAQQRSDVLRGLMSRDPERPETIRDVSADVQRTLLADPDISIGEYGPGGTGIDEQIGKTTKEDGMAPWMRKRGASEREIQKMLDTDFINDEDALRAWRKRWIYDVNQ